MTTAAEFNEQLERILAGVPPPNTVPAAETRRLRREGAGVFPPPVYLPEAKWLKTPGGVRLRVLRPAAGTPRGIYIHLHGGGWTLGAADLQDQALQDLADATALVVASVEYRLAPEHPYPAGPDDCEAAVRWLLEAGPAALDAPAWFAIGGESAGAHLAVVTLTRLPERGAIAAANLSFGCYDMSMTPSQRQWGDRYLVLSTPVIAWFADNFLPGLDAEARRAREISPLYARLEGMPKALFTVGDLDPLLDDSLFMYERWRAAGNEAELAVYPQAVHGFTAYPVDVGEAALRRQYEFLR